MNRCERTGKLRFRDAGVAARYVERGEHRGLYTCPYCGSLHLTKKVRREAFADASPLTERGSGG